MSVLRVGVVGYSGQKFDEGRALALIQAAYDTITAQYPQHDVTIVAGLTNVGIPAIAYAEAARRGWRTAGVACKKVAQYDCFPVDEEPVLVGEKWGEESPAFIATIDALIRVGGGSQSRTETATVKAQGKPVIEYDLPVK